DFDQDQERDHKQEQADSFRACCYNCFRSIHVTIASLKFGFQFYFEPRQIDKVPASELPKTIFSAWRVLKAYDEMDRVIAYLVCRDFWLEIECPKSAVTTSDRVKFWIQIENPLAGKIDNSHHAVLHGMWEIAAQSR